jgi:phenylpyruvate tautomerase PptA (4-oxalocrotonate tautomerase family)
MVTVKLPRADWVSIDVLLEELEKQGWIVSSLRKDINKQVDKQEY